MEIGKVSNQLLDEIVFSKIKYRHEDVLVGSGLSEDCSLISFGDQICVISTDPITATASNIGRLSVLVSGNDVATKGVKPFGIMVTVLAPPSATIEELRDVIGQVIDECNRQEVELIGGHTEVTDAVNRIVFSATSLGKGLKKEIVYDRLVKEGDRIILTKYAGCEGTVILYDEFPEEIHPLLNDREHREVEQLRHFLSVTKEGVLAARLGAAYMHDVTEGGVLGAIWESANKFGLGVHIQEMAIPILSATRKIASHFGMDPLKLISSGMMLIAAEEEKATAIVAELTKEKIPAAIVGGFTEKNLLLKTPGGTKEIHPPQSDELYKAYR
ncbi:AIR synthase family protein [Alkalibacter rhizosphaerae]|uniref:AIR synthase family protein n=1 Tax=Alkalibacter rhizosphaerae TaxID=2815577 RepID=A0A975AHW8_9FIRM|nr:AIR synthase family protein [Alkalibacter rhizosphaerae]QSX08064.1 AIR synthase family protein [Alkalibacter rhizosphaerae]